MGYQQGVMNQIYFDAPAKVILLEHALNKNKDGTVNKEIIQDLIFKQKRILHHDEFSSYWATYHPVHEEVRLYFKSKIEDVCGKKGCTCDPMNR